jgi:DNA invertase Pin-like site-specific DNA recombinase
MQQGANSTSLFWALYRFSREEMAQTIGHLRRLTSYGVSFHSYTEPHLATDNELARNILLALLSSSAKVEAQQISDRTKADMARAKAKRIKIGASTHLDNGKPFENAEQAHGSEVREMRSSQHVGRQARKTLRPGSSHRPFLSSPAPF